MALSITHLLNKTMSLSRTTRVQSGIGFVEQTSVINASAPCRIFDLSGNDEEFAASLQMVASHVIYVDPALDIQRDDVATIDGVQYEIRRTTEPSDTVYIKAFAEEIQIGT